MALANGEARKANSGIPITAFVLAGGRSSRMGRDKALLSLGDQNLLQRALRVASEASGKTYIVGSKQLYGKFGEVIEDIYSGCGPLGGIHAALTSTDTDLNLIISVDMPGMKADFLRWFLAKSAAKSDLIVVPEAAGGLQPLCAIYRKAVASAAQQALQQGECKVGRLFSQIPTCIIGETEILAAGFSPELFQNINTPEEYANCRS
jgi:molybdopterin-guanine dinucleotide biosynthesis protein A